MSELRVNNIVSEDGSAAPIYSRGMNIGAGTTLTCDGNFVVGGATSIAGSVEVGGLFKANTLTPLTGDTVTISSGKFLAVGGGVTVTNAGTFTVSGPTSFQSGAVVTGVVTFTEADLQASLTLDGLDVGSNIKLGNAGVITATSFSGDGSNLTGIDATTIVNGTSNVTVAASGDITATRSGTTRLTVDNAGVEVNGTFDVGGGNVAVTRTSGQLTCAFTATASNSVVEIGGSTGAYLDLKSPDSDDFDLRLGSTGTGGFIQIASGNLAITGTVVPGSNNAYDLGASGLQFRDAYFDGTVTTDNLTCDSSANFNHGAGGAVTIGANGDIRFTDGTWSGNTTSPKIQAHDNALYILGGPSGIIFRENGTDRCLVDDGGNFRPAVNNQYDLGTSTARWRNLYTNDLNLSNEGGANDVDGTWGDWTIQEGENDLFIINRRNGKKFKINLTEVN